MAITLTAIGGTFGIGSLDLDNAECNPIHILACEAVNVNPSDEEISVSPVIGWRDCPELDELLEQHKKLQIYAVIEAAAIRCKLCWVQPA